MDQAVKKYSARRGWVEMLISWWWVALFICCSYLFYSQAVSIKMQSLAQLKERVVYLRQLKEDALMENEELEMKIHSQSDPLWIELTLKKRLGLAGEGQKKIHFHREGSK